MKKTLLLLLNFSIVSIAQQKQNAKNVITPTKPKLVVGIVIDQMRMEYLYRFANDFSDNGFKRIMNNGFTFHNAHYNYMPTYTAPGHASIYTGTTPAIHGIVGNEWFSRKLGKDTYCTEDASVSIIGNGDPKEGGMSPKNLQSTTITDELRLGTNFKGKVIGMSLKDRGAILPAGHFANGAFWYSSSGNFISSTFYGSKLPDWVEQFNNEKKYMDYIVKGWNLFKPAVTYNESDPDDSPYESKLYGAEKPVFPYNLKAMYDKNNAGILRATPFGNNILADFATRAIEKEQLGADDITDFLTVSFSSTDYVGHYMGARSMELQDTYLRLDETLANFMNFLDQKVGKGNYLMFLTADHACAENGKFLHDSKYNVINIEAKEIRKTLEKFSLDYYGDNLVLDYSNFNLFFDREKVKAKGLELSKVKQAFKDFLMTQDQIKKVYSEEEILANSGADYYLNMIAKGYDPSQNGDLILLDKPGYIEYGAVGTSHGTPYAYDTHAPLLFYGWGIPKGESHSKKLITQIAPSLAQKLKITFPSGSEAEILEEIFK